MPTHLRDDECQAKTESFWQWVQQRPGISVNPGVRIVDLRDQGQGRGVVATQDVEKDDELFTVSFNEILTPENSALNGIIPNELSKLQPWVALVLTMIYEDGKGEDSAWWPYLRILPAEFDTLVYWSPTELKELRGSTVVDKIGKEEADAHFRNDLFPIIEAHPTLLGRHGKALTGPEAEANLLILGHRMATLMLAYAFELVPDTTSENESDEEEEEEEEKEEETQNPAGDLKKGMIPLADLLNANGDLKNAHLVRNGARMTMTAIDRIKAGEQIFNDFGDLPRSDLLRRYGYITDNYKKWDVVEIPLSLVCDAAAKYNPMSEEQKAKRLSLADDWAAVEDGYDLSWPPTDEDFAMPLNLQLTILALVIDEGDYVRMQSAQIRPSKTRLSARHIALYRVFRDAIAQRLTFYATTITQDIKMLEDSSLGKRHRMAVEVRMGEKEILVMALDVATKWIDQNAKESEEGRRENDAVKRVKRRKL